MFSKKRRERIQEERERLWVEFIRKNAREDEYWLPVTLKPIDAYMLHNLVNKRDVRLVSNEVYGFEVFFYKLPIKDETTK